MSRDHGEASVLGLVLITPVALAVGALIVWIGRKVDTDARVQAASAAAAQAAALQRTPALAESAAQATAAVMLDDARACAADLDVVVDTSRFGPGGEVTVTVACSPLTSDVALAAPHTARFSASSTASIDPYRSAGLP